MSPDAILLLALTALLVAVASAIHVSCLPYIDRLRGQAFGRRPD